MTERYGRNNPSGDHPFNICPREWVGDYRASDCGSPLSLARYFKLSGPKGQVRPQIFLLNAELSPALPDHSRTLEKPRGRPAFSQHPPTPWPTLAPYLRLHKLFLPV